MAWIARWQVQSSTVAKPPAPLRLAPVCRGQHPGIGSQGIAEEAARPGICEPVPVGGLWLLTALGQLQATPRLAIRAIEQVPAAGRKQLRRRGRTKLLHGNGPGVYCQGVCR